MSVLFYHNICLLATVKEVLFFLIVHKVKEETEFPGDNMEIIKLLALVLGAALMLSACAAYDYDVLSYQEGEIRAEICWTVGEVRMGAEIHISAPKQAESGDDGDGMRAESRDVSLTFNYPDSLGGISVSRVDGKVTASLGEVIIDDPEISGWLEIENFFNIEADVKDTYVTEIDGTKVNYIEAVSDDDRTYGIYLIPDTGHPRRICGSIGGMETVMDVIWFEASGE